MKVFVVLFSLLAAAIAADSATEFCYSDVLVACNSGGNVENCNAKYGSASGIMGDLQGYVNTHITRSFDYLLLSTNFAAYEKNRLGFEKLYRQLSDSTWNDAIDLIKYITKRGGSMDFNARKEDKLMESGNFKFDLNEIASLSRVLDSQKLLAEEAHHIHALAARHRENYHDPEVASYLENNFLHKHADTIRDLAGYTSDLKRMIAGTRESSLAVFLFDEYLKKSL